MSILRHQYLFQMLSRCIYDIWERFCVAKINIVHFTSKNSSTRFSFFCYSLLYTILAGDKSRAGFVRRTFNPKSTGVLSMQKCIEWVVPRRGNEIHFLSTFPYNAIRPMMTWGRDRPTDKAFMSSRWHEGGTDRQTKQKALSVGLSVPPSFLHIWSQWCHKWWWHEGGTDSL